MEALFDTIWTGARAVLAFSYDGIAVWQVLIFGVVLHYLRLAWQHEKYLRKSFRYEWAYLKAKAMGKQPERRRWGGSFGTTPNVLETPTPPTSFRDMQGKEAPPELPEQGFYTRKQKK
ncbi:MAG: hypothetical protein GC134_09755 [Proteobacteria bacterium]|nr:hypothetical protein [Pseudomonadota bacterium]